MEVNEHILLPKPREVLAPSDQTEVFLTVKIGNAQEGGNFLTADGNEFKKGDFSTPISLGMATELLQKDLFLVTNVLDLNSFSNQCVITTTFTDGNKKVLFTEVDNGLAPEDGIASFQGNYLVKILVTVLLLFFIAQPNVLAQGSDQSEFSALATPASPGFILFDQTPSAIEKPATPQGLGFSLLSLQQNGGAIEVAPYWLKVHPNLTAEAFNKLIFPIVEHLAISIASVEADLVQNFAVGLRTRLLQVYDADHLQKLSVIKSDIITELSNPVANLDLVKIESLRQQYVDISSRPTVHIDFAAAVGGTSLTKSYDDIEYSRWATWLSFNYRPKGDDFYFTVLSRFRNSEDPISADSTSVFDVGSRLNYDIQKFALSVEYLQRLDITNENSEDFRLAFIGTYKINNALYLTSTFGKNFDDIDNVIALAGINFGLSKNKVKAF